MKDGKLLAKEMVDFVNQIDESEFQVFVKEMLKAHLTLQQSFTRLCMGWFKGLAKSPFFDDRNHQSVIVAKEITKQHGDHYFPFI